MEAIDTRIEPNCRLVNQSFQLDLRRRLVLKRFDAVFEGNITFGFL